MQGLDLKSTRQKILLIVAAAVLLIAAIVVWRQFARPPAVRLAAERVYKCIECGHDFEHTLSIGDKEPFKCPQCGKMTGYKAEPCFWTKDGKAKREPTFVVVKSRVDPDNREKTYCPDCEREVVTHNPWPPKALMDAAQAEAGKK